MPFSLHLVVQETLRLLPQSHPRPIPMGTQTQKLTLNAVDVLGGVPGYQSSYLRWYGKPWTD
ncbi:hypothetical protein BC829DRAFT_389076 [Chytridium lagenaria]|nr:hypothetical protein BC829DRAFT_389076 [Chytridium lagenaria]